MKTSQTFFYNEENGNIQYLDKRGFIGELCIVISKKDKNILCLDEIKKIYNLSYKDIVKKFEKVFKKLDNNIYGLKVQSKLGLICLIDKSTEDFEKYCKKNKLKFGQEVSNINKKNLFTKEGKCDIINYKPKESKEELKNMNKKLVKRVAVASLAALMTIPSLTTTSYALEVTRYEDGTYKSASFDNDQEAVEFFKEEIAKNGHLYNEFRRKDLQKQLDSYEKIANGGSKNVVDVSAVEAELAKREQERLAREAEIDAKKAAEKAAEDEANAIYGTHIFHGDTIDEYILQWKRRGSEKCDPKDIDDTMTWKHYVDKFVNGNGTYSYRSFMKKTNGVNPFNKAGKEAIENVDFTLSFGKGKYNIPVIKDRAPHLKLELVEIEKAKASVNGQPVNYGHDIENAIVKITYISPVDGILQIGGFLTEIGTDLRLASNYGNAKYVFGLKEGDSCSEAQLEALRNKQFYVNKGVNEFCLSTRIKTYMAGTTTPAPGFEDMNHPYPTQEMLNRVVQSVYDRKTQFLVSLHPTIIHEEYIDD